MRRPEFSVSLLKDPILLRRNRHATTANHRHRKHGLHAALLQPGHADDAGAGFLLRRWIIDRITKVKVDEAGETEGLDMAIHGEAAYLEGI